jgi:hypothetical protein
MVNFIQVGDRWFNASNIIIIEHHREDHCLRVVFTSGTSIVLNGDEAQNLLLHLERPNHAPEMPFLWPKGVGTPIGDDL